MVQLIRFFFLFILLLLLQAFILDKINMPELVFQVRPVLFFFFILALPLMPAWAMQLIGFVTGLTYDLLYHTPGVHAAACVFVAFSRNWLVNLLKEKEDGIEASPHIPYMGFGRYFMFALVCAFFFHLIVTFLTVFSFKAIGDTFLIILANTLISALLIYIFDIIFFYRRRSLK